MAAIQPYIFITFVVVYTLAVTYWDQRYWKIPNKFTLPMFFAGWVYQGVFNGLQGIGDGALGFLVGFGFLFILWIIGSSGGGDVKLMGGLSVWLGFYWSVYVFIVSTFLVILVTLGVVIWNVITVGAKNTKKKILATGKPTVGGAAKKVETTEQKQQRRIMAYALPISLATWGLLLLGYFTSKPTLPWNM